MESNGDSSLAIFKQGALLLAQANTVQKANELRNLALTAADWARRKGAGEEAIQHCRHYAFEAERRMGELLLATERHPPGPDKQDRLLTVTDPAPTLADLGITKRESSQAQQLAELPLETFERVRDGEIARNKTSGVLILQSTNNEWYTPAEYIESVRRVLGPIDLDPASCPAANEVVRATTYYTIEQDGLTKSWWGTVWLNPPWGGKQAEFAAKLLTEYEAGRCDASILLVNAHCTDTSWFQPLWNHTLCFTDHRIRYRPQFGKAEDTSPTHGSVFVYLGKAHAVFQQEFAQFGAIVRRYLP